MNIAPPLNQEGATHVPASVVHSTSLSYVSQRHKKGSEWLVRKVYTGEKCPFVMPYSPVLNAHHARPSLIGLKG